MTMYESVAHYARDRIGLCRNLHVPQSIGVAPEWDDRHEKGYEQGSANWRFVHAASTSTESVLSVDRSEVR